MNNEVPELIWISVDKRLQWTDYKFDGGIPYRRVDPPAAPIDRNSESLCAGCRETIRNVLAYGKSPVLAEIARLVINETSSQDKCKHGVLWSMECLSCGPSEYVAAAPAAPDERDKARIDDVLRAQCRHAALLDSEEFIINEANLRKALLDVLATVRAEVWRDAIRVAQLSAQKSQKASLDIAAAEILIRRLEIKSARTGKVTDGRNHG